VRKLPSKNTKIMGEPPLKKRCGASLLWENAFGTLFGRMTFFLRGNGHQFFFFLMGEPPLKKRCGASLLWENAFGTLFGRMTFFSF